MRITLASLATAAAFAFVAHVQGAEPALDYDYYKARVEPLFLNKRDGHARCFVCHVDGNNAFRLQKLAGKNKTWSEEESRKNFAMASALVTPGNPDKSSVIQRVRLPLDNDEHMPPKKEPQPSAAEIAAFVAWVRSSSSPSTPIATRPASPDTRPHRAPLASSVRPCVE